MARPLRLEFENAHYHIINRGDRKYNVFDQTEFKIKMIQKMDETFRKYDIICYAYCIMNNHYHLYISTPHANLTKAMHNLNTSYSNWYKARTQCVGHVFQGRYKSILIDSDNYSLQLVNYIHLNPVKSELEKRPEDYNFSSLNYYLGRKEKVVFNLDRRYILEQFSDNVIEAQKKYYNYLTENIDNYSLKTKIYKNIAIGDEKFCKQIDDKIKKFSNDEELPTTHMDKTRYPEYYIDIILKEFNIKEKDLFSNKKNNIYKKILIYYLKTRTRMTLLEIGNLFSMNYKTVSKYFKRFSEEMNLNQETMDFFNKINLKLKK
ncbi:MAG: transposase [Candidatus Muiribacteriota bacterium]|jgi:REP element-mobilizing transposase RayT